MIPESSSIVTATHANVFAGLCVFARNVYSSAKKMKVRFRAKTQRPAKAQSRSYLDLLTRAERAECVSQFFNFGDQLLVPATSLLHYFARRAFHKRNIVEPRRKPSRLVFLLCHLLDDSLAFFFEVDQAP